MMPAMCVGQKKKEKKKERKEEKIFAPDILFDGESLTEI